MDLAAQYNNRALVPDHERIISGWYADAAAYRGAARADLDIAYGARPRNRVDIFHPAETAAGPLVVFIHGGYWRSLDKSAFSHMAAGANAHGFTVAVPTYSLCPEVTIPDIVDELRQCCLFLHKTFNRPLVIAGHSAGGHLTACMAATDWSHFGTTETVVQAGFSISGIFDLRPLMATPLNDDLKLTSQTAMMASPLFWPVPRNLPFDSWVGAKESQEFLRQSRSIAAAWTGLGMNVPHVEVPGANHFSVPADLADPDSAMTIRLVELANS
jgi:arylformamidase